MMIHRQPIKERHQVRVTFALPLTHPPHAVSLVGDFNDWSPHAHPLQPDADGMRSTTMTLAIGGRYAFRYLSADGRWFNDGFADAFEPNAYGADNSILYT